MHACCWRDRLTWVGAVVGTTVGSTVGAVVGATVGGVVGGTVGALVGATLGGTVGMTVGGRVGTRVGHMVGACREKGGAVPRQGARDESERLERTLNEVTEGVMCGFASCGYASPVWGPRWASRWAPGSARRWPMPAW